MFAIGFLSLLSVGFVAMSMGGDDDAAEVEEQTPTEPEVDATLGDVQIDILAGDDPVADPAGDDGGDDDDASVADEDTVGSDTAGDDAGESGTGEDGDAVDRPPMGDEYRDPLKIAEELEAQRIAEEIAAEQARIEAAKPVNLVTVLDAGGTEIDDAQVLQDLRADGVGDEDAEAGGVTGHTVTAPDTPHSIDVGYNPDATFDITYNAQTTSVTAGLNSTIEGPEGTFERAVTEEQDDAGVDVSVVTWIKSYEGATDITVDVAQEDVGPHVAQISLLNPADTLHFDFADDVTGNLHLVYDESESGTEGATNTTKRAFVIQTAADVTALSEAQIGDIVAQDGAAGAGTTVLAEIYLGEDTLFVNGSAQNDEDYEFRIMDFINDAPLITANVDWTSVAEHDDTAPPGPEADGEREDDDDGMFGGLELPFTIPFFP